MVLYYWPHNITRFETANNYAFSPGDSFLLNLIVNYIYILALMLRGITIIESDFDWNT
jgi:hypothetical protein